MDRSRKPHWTDYAACRGLEMDQTLHYFFPDNGVGFKGSAASMRTAVADAERLFCGGCPVRAVCLERALDSGAEQFGIRAATSPETRRALARTRTRAKCPECRQPRPARVIEPVDGTLVVHQVCSACGLSWTAEPSLAEAS